MKKDRTTALITDMDRRKSIPIIRTLGRHGVRVIGLSYRRAPMGAFSRYCNKVYSCPDYRVAPNAFVKRLESVCMKEKPDTFYPIEDQVMSLCLKHPEAWQPHTRALLPAPEALERAYDKWETIRYARQAGISVPFTLCPDTLAEADKALSRWEGPAVIKPRKSSGSRGLRYVDHPSGLMAAYEAVARDYPRPLIQERIPRNGAGLGVFVLLNHELDPLAVFGHKRLREYPVSGGPSTLRVSYRNNALIRQTVRLFQKMELVGVAMAEYKFDHRTHRPVLLEINPRFWGSIQLAIHAGVDFPLLYHQAGMGRPVSPVLDYPLEKYCRWMWPGDILHFLSNPNRLNLTPKFFSFRNPDTSFDILSKSDPLPAFGILLESFRKLLKAV